MKRMLLFVISDYSLQDGGNHFYLNWKYVKLFWEILMEPSTVGFSCAYNQHVGELKFYIFIFYKLKFNLILHFFCQESNFLQTQIAAKYDQTT